MQRTLFILKPDCLQRRLAGEVLRRFEAKGLKLAGLKLLKVSDDLAKKHYAVHKDRPFFGGLIQFITSGPVIVGVLEGPDAVEVLRNLMGPTSGVKAAPGTVRGDFALSIQNNLIHGSDSAENAALEIALWFAPEELVDYPIAGNEWVVAS
jgi:nucleoside-diphosphate kinase